MPSSSFPACAPALAFVLILCGILDFVFAEISCNLVKNGNFEELVGSFPAGVVVPSSSPSGNRLRLIPHWDVQGGTPVEIISSLLWQSGPAAKSLYAMHLNSRAGPGGIQTKVRIPCTSSGAAKYRLSFDMAGNPTGGSSVKRLEVDVSASECHPKKLSFTVAQGANWKCLKWKTVHLIFEVHGRKPAMTLQFRSLTPGAYGPVIDNVRLTPLPLETEVYSSHLDDKSFSEHLDFCSVDDEEALDKSSILLLMERLRMTTETWIRQRFSQRVD